MKKYIAAILFMFFTLASYTQVQRNTIKQSTDSAVTVVEPSAKKDKRERMKELNLSKDQRSKLKEINLAHKNSKNAIEMDATLSATQKQEKLKMLRKAHAEKMRTILTAEQIEKFKQSKKEKDQQLF